MVNLDFREKTSLNVLTNLLRTAALALIGMFMVPYYVNSLGIASYAILPLATTMSSYIQIISDAVAYAAVRYNTLAFEKDDKKLSNVTVSSSFFGLLKVCLAVAPIGILLAIASPAIFDITGSESIQVQGLFALIIFSSLLVTMSTPFEGVFYASNNLYLMYLARLGYFIVQVVTIVILFTLGTPTLIDIGIGYVFAGLTTLVLFYIFAKHTEPDMRISRDLYDRALFKKIGALGAWSLAEKIGGMLYINLSLVLVNLYMGSAAQGGFAIITTMLTMVNNVSYALVDSINPYIYKCYAESRERDLEQVIKTGSKMVVIVLAFPIAFLIVFCNEFLGAWLGEGYEYLAKMVIIGLLGNFTYCAISTMTVVPRIYLKMRPLTIVTIILGLANVVLTILFLGSMQGNEETAIFIWAVCMSTLSIYTAVNDATITHAKPHTYLVPLALGVAIILVCYYPLTVLHDFLCIPSNWIPLIIVLLITFAIYFVVAYMLLFSRKEKTMVNALVPHKLSRFLPTFSLK